MIPSQCRYGYSPSLKSFEHPEGTPVRESMTRIEDKKFYDINSHSVGVVAGAFLEEGVNGDIRKRVNKADSYGQSRLNTDSWDWNEHSSAEKEATANAFELAKDGYNFVVWISPDDGGQIYKEGRLNVYLPEIREGEWSLQGWGIPLLLDRFESTNLAKELLRQGGISMDPIYDSESTRRQPIGFKIPNTINWVKECKKLMPEFKEIWKFIEEGGEIQNKKKVEADVISAMLIARGDNRLFEMSMAQMGHYINPEGGHGSSWLGGVNKGIYNFRLNIISGNYVTEPIRVNGKTICPVCGVELKEGKTICYKCGVEIKYKRYELFVY